MSKKSRKRKRSSKPNLPAQTLKQVQSPQTKAPEPRRPQAQATGKARQRATREVDLAQEYRYVADDLSRIATLAGILLLGLVVLSFFI